MPNYGIPTLVKTAGTHIKSAMQADGKATEEFRKAAIAIVGIRAKTKDENGQPDWAGRSAAYRAHVAEVYAAAGIPEDSQSNVQARLRYHIGTALRDHVPTRDLARAGLKAEGPRERANARQQTQKAAVSVLGSKAPTGSMLEAVQQASAMLQHASTLKTPADETERANLGILLLMCESVLTTLRQATVQAPAVPAAVKPRGRPRKATAKQALASAA